jgi:phosphatidylglycerophosphate synthase
MKTHTLKEIKEAYHQKKEWEKQFPINYFLFRPVSFYLTFFALKITENPAKVALFGFILGLAGCILLACASIISIWPGIIFILLYSVSDAVDGNIARTTQNVTLFGKYLDGLLGDIIDGCYFFFLGIGLFISGVSLKNPLLLQLDEDAKMIPLLLGAIILIGKLWAKIFEARYHSYRIQNEGLPQNDQFEMKKAIGKSTYTDRWYFLAFINIDCLNNQLLLLILLHLWGLQIWFLLFFAFFYSMKSLLFFIFYFNKTRLKLTKKH